LLLSIEDNSIAFRAELKDELRLGYFWVWPDFLFILAFRNWVCFGFVFLGRKVVHFHNPFVKKRLRSFWPLLKLGLNWVCLFGLKNHLFSVILFYKLVYIHFGFSEIWFYWV